MSRKLRDAGEHPTTKLCLQWLDRQQLQDKLVLDYGTGTGILGIAALLKGDPSLCTAGLASQLLFA